MSKPGTDSGELSTLRALTFRLSSTPTAQLPQQIPAITASLANCRTLFSSSPASGSKTASEASVVVHRYRTCISTLLQDRTIPGRWAAVVLVKATVEIGGWETLQKSLPWVRHLLDFLSKPDPAASKKLCLLTLTRIFLLTREYPTLIREITTPSLPTYIQKCIQVVSSNPPSYLLQTVLESFNQLLPRHPTIFRSYLKQLQQLVCQIISLTPSNKLSREQQGLSRLSTTSSVVRAAQQLYVQLPCCAPKDASSEEWDKALRGVISNAHQVADKVFRAVIEDWQSVKGPDSIAVGHTLDDEVQNLEKDSMDLLPWSGIYAGGERLIAHLGLLKGYLSTKTLGPVSLPVGFIMDFATRILSLTVPSPSSPNSTRLNHQVSKEEREHLWTLLPQVHIAMLEVLLALMDRCEQSSVALDAVLLEQVGWVFEAEQNDAHIRTACYLTVAQCLLRSGSALPKSSVDPLAALIRACCNDVLPIESKMKHLSGQSKSNGAVQQQVSTNADAFLQSSSSQVGTRAVYSALYQAAYDLLPIMLSRIRPQLVSDKLITTMYRTAVLAQHKDAMIASVLNPQSKKKSGKASASLLPLLVRSFGDDRDVESFVRPRMPVLHIGSRYDEVEDGPEEDTADAIEEEDDHFVGQELDTLLKSATHDNQNDEYHIATEAAVPDLGQTVSSPAVVPAALDTELHIPNSEDTKLGQSLSKNKRPQEEEERSPSPTKRLKVEAAEPTASISIPNTITTTSSIGHDVTAIVSTQKEVAPQSIASLPPATTIPAAPAAPADNSSDDDDDFGELVLGQDTDDESG